MNSDVILRKYAKARMEQSLREADAERIRAEIQADAQAQAQVRSGLTLSGLWSAIQRMYRTSIRRARIDEGI